KKLIMLPSETMIWQPEFTDKTLSRKPGAVHSPAYLNKTRGHDCVLVERNRTVIADSPNLHCGVNKPHARVLSVLISASGRFLHC
ncbi:hypothetical protein ACEA55_23325, partial [Escherichia coli]